MFNPPKKITASVSNVQILNETDLELTFELNTSTKFSFRAGQFISINCGENVYRSYSISSSTSDNTHVSIIASVGHEGIGAAYLKNLKKGACVEFIGPSGRFVLPETLKSNLVFIGTGTGVAPMLSMIDALKNNKVTNSIHLYFGVRSGSEVFKLTELEKLKHELPNFDYTLCFSQQVPSALKAHVVAGRVSDALKEVDTNDTQYFLCGNPFMVSDMLAYLTSKGVDDADVLHEKFTTSKK